MASRIPLAKISSLTFYKDALTRSRRGKPISQLVCVGDACKFYQPDVVRCENVGGYGTEVDWKCEADLPEALRFGRVEVSCEGWNGPGDNDVLKGSCSLQYRLVHVPKFLRNDDSYLAPVKNWFTTENLASTLFYVLWFGILAFILYSIFQSWRQSPATGQSRPGSSGPGSGSSGRGWFPWDNPDNHSGSHDHNGAPPPYTKYPENMNRSGNGPGGLGFWSGALLGGLGTYLFNRGRGNDSSQRPYDWDRQRSYSGFQARPSPGLFSRPSRTYSSTYDDRGEGPSHLGSMRRSTGYGGSSVR